MPVAAAGAAITVGQTIGHFVGDIFGGGNPWDKAKDRAQDAGHAASAGNVAAVTTLEQTVTGSKYQQARDVAKNYLNLLAVGRGYDGKKTISPVAASVQSAAKASLTRLGLTPSLGGAVQPSVPGVGVGVAQAAPPFQGGVDTIAGVLANPQTKWIIGIAVIGYIAYHAYKTR